MAVTPETELQDFREMLRRFLDSDRTLVAEAKAKADILLNTHAIILERLSAISSDHERRIRFLERGLAYGAGAAGMLVGVGKVLKVI